MSEQIQTECDNCGTDVVVELGGASITPAPGTVFEEDCPSCGETAAIPFGLG